MLQALTYHLDLSITAFKCILECENISTQTCRVQIEIRPYTNLWAII